MSKEIKKEELKSKEELSREEKKRLRAAAIHENNGLELDESLKKPGMKYRLCNVTPGNIERYRSMGYSPVQGPNGAVELEVGKRTNLKAIWMETSDENYEILREIETDKAKAQEMMMFSDIPKENRIGTVTTEFKQ